MNNELETLIDTIFEIERVQLPRSEFAGIRKKSGELYAKRTNNLRNNAFKKTKIDNNTIEFKIDLGIAPYAKYINEQNKYITKGYMDKIAKDVYERIKNHYGGGL